MKKVNFITAFWGIILVINIIGASLTTNLTMTAANSYTTLDKENESSKITPVDNKTSFTTTALKIKRNDLRFTLNNMLSILTNDLKNANIVYEVNDNHNLLAENKKWYVINPNHNFTFIRVPLILEKLPQKLKKIYLIFDCTNFKLQGYQKIKDNRIFYFYFNDATITNTWEPQTIFKSGSIGITLKEQFAWKLNVNAKFDDLKSHNSIVSWRTITDSFSHLCDDNIDQVTEQIDQYEVENIMLVTLEALKFRSFETIITHSSEPWSTKLLNNWMKYLVEELEHWEKSDGIKRIVETLEKKQNLNDHILNDYKELILPVSMFKYIKKNENNNYILELLEKKFYFDATKKNTTIRFTESFDPTKIYQNYAIYEFNLNKINPLSINKITFMGDTSDDDWGVKSNWGTTVIWNKPDLEINKVKKPNYIYQGVSIDQSLKRIDNNLQSILNNKKITHHSSWKEIKSAANYELQHFQHKEFLAAIIVLQKFGITWYYNEVEGNYYLQIIIYQSLESFLSFSNISATIKLGNGIRLYSLKRWSC